MVGLTQLSPMAIGVFRPDKSVIVAARSSQGRVKALSWAAAVFAKPIPMTRISELIQ